MTIWLYKPPVAALTSWIKAQFGEECLQVRNLGLKRASDAEIFFAARGSARMLITKDHDFAELVSRLGPPPSIILLTIGNTSTAFGKANLAAISPGAGADPKPANHWLKSEVSRSPYAPGRPAVQRAGCPARS